MMGHGDIYPPRSRGGVGAADGRADGRSPKAGALPTRAEFARTVFAAAHHLRPGLLPAHLPASGEDLVYPPRDSGEVAAKPPEGLTGAARKLDSRSLKLTPFDPAFGRPTSPLAGKMSEPDRRKYKTMKRARSLRKRMTNAEVILWQHLRRKQVLGLPIRRQHPVGPFIADFACNPLKLIIEVDGDTHTDAAYDARRTQFLEAQGWQVLRVFNVDVYENLEGVMDRIGATLAELQRSKSAAQAANKKVDKDLDPRSGKD